MIATLPTSKSVIAHLPGGASIRKSWVFLEKNSWMENFIENCAIIRVKIPKVGK